MQAYFHNMQLLALMKAAQACLQIFMEFLVEEKAVTFGKYIPTSNYTCTVSIISHHIYLESILFSKRRVF